MAEIGFGRVNEMLKEPKFLTEDELEWVKLIDDTCAQYREPEMTSRQQTVILDIYGKFSARKEGRPVPSSKAPPDDFFPLV